MMQDKRAVRRLTKLVANLEQEADPVRRAKAAIALRDVAESIVASSIRDANRGGLTWREIGARLGIPFQTLFRRYGGEGQSPATRSTTSRRGG